MTVIARPVVLHRISVSVRCPKLTMPAKRLKELLDSHQVKYVTMTHSAAYTAQEIADLAHVRGEEFAKTVIVRIDGVMVMAVLPASYHVDLPLLKAAAQGKKIALASETDFRDRFPECETGAMPPFGQLYGMSVFVDDGQQKRACMLMRKRHINICSRPVTLNTGISYFDGPPSHCELRRVVRSQWQTDGTGRRVRPGVLEHGSRSRREQSHGDAPPGICRHGHAADVGAGVHGDIGETQGSGQALHHPRGSARGRDIVSRSGAKGARFGFLAPGSTPNLNVLIILLTFVLSAPNDPPSR
jgi:Ala-tRNA(Pro) deacylase